MCFVLGIKNKKDGKVSEYLRGRRFNAVTGEPAAVLTRDVDKALQIQAQGTARLIKCLWDANHGNGHTEGEIINLNLSEGAKQ
jgi:hypothetical protein